jgi:hypothetical protein
MECVLCEMWARMPYIKKPTTPTTVQETEEALIIGYWLGHIDTDISVCERHESILKFISKQETTQQSPVEPSTHSSVQQHLNPLYIPFRPPTPPTPPIEPFIIGPGALVNGNSLTNQPPLPVEADPSAIYREAAARATSAKPGTVEGALEAAKAAPTEGGKVSYNCTLCGASVMTGDVHAC